MKLILYFNRIRFIDRINQHINVLIPSEISTNAIRISILINRAKPKKNSFKNTNKTQKHTKHVHIFFYYSFQMNKKKKNKIKFIDSKYSN